MDNNLVGWKLYRCKKSDQKWKYLGEIVAFYQSGSQRFSNFMVREYDGILSSHHYEAQTYVYMVKNK
jgi:hypothetical protein